jgi:urocanate hydratase
LGFGPFRWICTSGLEQDLEVTDRIAQEVLESIVQEGLPDNIAVQYQDNIKWIKEAGRNRLVVGSQARILYADQRARVTIALAFNQAIQGSYLIDSSLIQFFFEIVKLNFII